MRLLRLFMVLICGISSLSTSADVNPRATYELCPGQKMKIYSNSTYDQNDGFNWRWEVVPSYQLKIITQTKEYCEIQAEQDISTVNLYFKYDYYLGASKTTSVVRWVIKYKAPPSYELKATPNGGSVEKGTKVTLTLYADGSPVYDDVSIKYTLNGSDPSLGNNGTKYTSAGITINEDCTLWAKAIRWESGCSLTETYTIAKNIEINATNFPDENFRNFLLSQSYGQDGILTVSEINSVSKMEVKHKEIKDLKGIEFFTALTELDCSSNYLESLDMSKNTALRYLNCNDYDLKYLNVSKNSALEWLYCCNNELQSLDVSKNTALIGLYCWSNQLTSLDISRNTSLEYLQCGSNKLTSIELPKNAALNNIRCESNQLRGAAMDKLISSLPQNNTGNRYEFCVVDPNSDYDGNICTKTQVEAVKAKGWFPCYYDYNNGKLGYWEYEGSNVEKWIDIDATNFPDESFRKYLLSTSYGENGLLTEKEIKNVTSIDVSGSSFKPGTISSLKGIENFTALRSLSCDYNQLSALDVSKNTALTSLKCGENQLVVLDVSNNTALTELRCHNNQLKSLDVSKNTALTELRCDENQLKTLDVSKNTALLLLSCTDNLLTSLDISKNTALQSLYCYNNQLTSLDVSKNTALTSFRCQNNQLTSFDVSKNTALKHLYCDSNRLTSLDVSKNTALVYLYCNSNRLTSLDVSKNTALHSLICTDNLLTSLDVSKNTELYSIYCAGNQIKDAAMDNLIKSLPVNQSGKEYWFGVVYIDREEGNVCSEEQVAAAKAKGWAPKAWNGSEWVDYEGEDIDVINQVTIGSALVAGYSSNKNLDFTSLEDKGVSAWIATSFDRGNVQLSRVYRVPAGEGVYVKAEKAGTYEIPTTKEEAFCVNMFVGVPYGKTVDMYEDYYGETYLTLSFALSKTTGKPGFFPNTEPKTYGKNKMYLHMPARLLPEYAKTRLNEFSLGIEFEDETTGISDAERLNDKGEMLNNKRGEVYDLQGRKLNAQGTMHEAQLPKGIYIKNGKKVVVP